MCIWGAGTTLILRVLVSPEPSRYEEIWWSIFLITFGVQTPRNLHGIIGAILGSKKVGYFLAL